MTFDRESELVELRRTLHRIPELSFRERETGQLLKGLASQWGTVRPVAGTGFWVDLGPVGRAPRSILLRADMDALPIQEETGLPYASTVPQRMHACGHDAHMAALMVAGRMLAEAPPDGVAIRVLFQPAEEGGGGALACIEEGVLEGIDVAFGIHVWNELPLGTVALTHGGIMAGVVELGLKVTGQGGHGAIPHRTRDPVVASAQLIMALQTIASRRFAPVEPVVVSVGSVHGGDAFNVIPHSVDMRGTCRGFSEPIIADLEEAVRAIAAGVEVQTGTRIEVGWKLSTRPTVNDPRVAEMARRAVDRMTGLNRVLTDYRTMAGEDFGEILRLVPGCFALVGSANPARGLVEPHHSPRFEIDEAALQIACDLHRAVVAEFAEHGVPGRAS
jgi:amidohydrolase